MHAGGSPSGAIFNWAGNAVLFIGSAGHIYQWNWRTSSHVQSIGGPLENPVLFPTSAGTLVASENGRTIAITSLSSGLPSAIQVPCCSFADASLNPAITFSPNGAEVATLTLPQSSSQQGVVSVFDVGSGAPIFSKTVPMRSCRLRSALTARSPSPSTPRQKSSPWPSHHRPRSSTT